MADDNIYDTMPTGLESLSAAPAATPAPAPAAAASDDAPHPPIAALEDQASAAAANPPSDNIYDTMPTGLEKLDDKSKGADTKPSISSVLGQVPTGANEALADTLGAPVDLTTWLANKVSGGINSAAGTSIPKIEAPFGGSDSLKSGLGYIKADPRNAPAKNAAERIARGIGAGAASAIVPEAAIGAAAKAGMEIPAIVGGAEAVPTSVRNSVAAAGSGAVGGGTGEAGSELAPDWAKPYANLAGNVIGGGAAALGRSAVGAAADSAAGAIKNATQPFTKSGQEAMAAEKFRAATSNPAAALDTLENVPGEIVSGSKPTTFQQTGDLGIGDLEKAARNKNMVPFAERSAEQNAARVGALGGVQETGAPSAVSDVLRGRLNDIDQQTQSAIDQATSKAQQATGDLGPGLSTEQHGANIAGTLRPQVESATQDVANQTQRIGAQATPEEHGAALRQSLADAEQQARASERQLWNSVDPDRKLVVSTGPVTDAATTAYSQLSPAAVLAMTPAEHNALAAINELGDTVHLQDITDLRSSLSGDMRAESLAHGKSPALRRLTQLRGSIDDAINGTINRTVEEDGAAAAAGKMQPQETMGAKLQREADAFRAARQNREAAETPEEAPAPTGITPGGARQAPEEPLEANFNQEDKDRLDAATAATRERATTFGRGDTGQILRKETGAPDYKMVSSAVPDKIFHTGNTGGEDVRAYLAATGNDPQAAAALHNYAAYSLRKAALRQDGTIDPKKYATWAKGNAEALNALPAEVRDNFANVARASESLNRFAPFRPDMAPSQTPELFFHPGPGGAEGVRQFKSLVGEDTANKMLSDYAADTLVQKAARADGTLDPAKFATWQKQHADALGELPGLSDRFSSAAKATEAISDAAAARKEALDTYQKGAVGNLINVKEPEDVTRAIGRMFGAKDSVAQFKQLAQEVEGNPAAKEGLRKSVVDHMMNKFLSNTEAATSGQSILKADAFQTFVRQNQAALKTVFSQDEINTMNAIANDLRRAKRSDTAIKVPAGSDTEQNRAGIVRHFSGQTILNGLLSGGGALGGALIGHGVTGAVTGAVAGAAGPLVWALRQNGISAADDLVRKALLDPDFARTLLKKEPMAPGRGSHITLQHKLGRSAMFSGVQQASQAPIRVPITGGTVVGGPPQ